MTAPATASQGKRAAALPRHHRLLLTTLLERARTRGFQRLHLDPTPRGGLRVRARLGSRLTGLRRRPLPPAAAQALVRALKHEACLDPREEELPQRGQFLLTLGGAEHEVRVATLPSRQGEHLLVELLPRPEAPRALEALGLDPADGARLRAALGASWGLVLIASPCLRDQREFVAACLLHLIRHDPGRTVFSVGAAESSWCLDGLVQLELRPEFHLTAPSVLRAALISEPDVLQVQLEDSAEVGHVALSAAQGGRLVLLSVAAPDSARAIQRLHALGLNPWSLAQALRVAVSPRCLPRLCPDCRESVPGPSRAAIARFAPRLVEEELLDEWPRAFRPAGCADCGESGYRGELTLCEVLQPEPDVVEQLSQLSGDAGAERLRTRTRTLREAALLRAATGELALIDALRLPL